MIRRLIFAILLFSAPASAVCHVVRPVGSGGSNNGNDWTNAFLGLPTTLVRGDVYFIATGTYGRYVFNTAESGTTLITIKKATATDHCTDTGYNDATMGVGQAVFGTSGGGSIWQFTNNGFWTVDGQRRSGLKSGHGFLLDDSGKNGATAQFGVNLSGTSSVHVTNVTIRYTEIAGGGVGSNSGDSFTVSSISRTSNVVTITTTANHRYLADSSTVVGSQIGVSGVADSTFNTTNSRVTAATANTISYSNSGANGSSSGGTVTGALGNFSEFDYRYAGCVDRLTLEFSYIHDTSDTPVQGDGSQGLGCVPSNLLMQYTTLARNTSNSAHHSEGIALNDANISTSIDPNGIDIWRYNVLEDQEGTGFWVCIGNCRNEQVYGNVFMWHQNNSFRRSGLGNGVVATTSSANLNLGAWVIYNNTFVNPGDNTGNYAQISTANVNANASGSVTVQNNICYLPTNRQCFYSSNSVFPISNDWTFCITTGGCPSETHIQTGTSSPLVDWVNENYHLTAATNAGNTLASPYNTDPDGLVRGADGVWDRGAFEFSTSSCSPVISSVTVNPTSVVGGNTSTGTVTISCAPSVDTAVSLSSSNTAVATVPATVTVLANQTTANFTVTTNAVCVSTNVTITATLGGNTTAALTVTAGAAPCTGANIIGIAKAMGTAIIQ